MFSHPTQTRVPQPFWLSGPTPGGGGVRKSSREAYGRAQLHLHEWLASTPAARTNETCAHISHSLREEVPMCALVHHFHSPVLEDYVVDYGLGFRESCSRQLVVSVLK